MRDVEDRKLRNVLISSIAVVLVLAFVTPLMVANAAPTTITAYQSQIPVNVKSPYQASQWTDTQTFTEPTSGITFAAKQNGTGWLFLMIWQQSSIYCYDQYCFGGIELGHLNNTQPMGSPTTPTIMILASTAFTGGVDEFVATGEQTPVSVESDGYKTQSTCGLTLSGNTYTAVCYRPFKLTSASPYDFTLGVGSTIELGFAVGEFSAPGDHSATDMNTYVLTFSSQTYSGTTTSTSSSSTTTITTTSSSSSSSSSLSSSSSSSSSSGVSSTTTTTTTTTSASISTSGSSAYALSVGSGSSAYSGTQSGLISGGVSGSPTATGTVTLKITNPSGNLVFSDAVAIQANGAFNDTFHTGVNSLWTTGNYTLTASWGTLAASSGFSYTSTGTNATTTVTTTISQSGTVTETVTTTVAQTQAGAIAGWVYAVIVVLLLACVAVGYIVRMLLESRRRV